MKRSQKSRVAAGLRIGIIAAKFNQSVTGKLLSSCLAGLSKHGVKDEHIHVVRVPGAFEIPLAARTMATTKQFDAVICLGAVIRGDTPHFDYICSAVSLGITHAALDTGVPVIFGVLTTETVAQAVERADPAQFNRGGEAAKSALEMVNVLRQIAAMASPADESGGTLPLKRVSRRHGR